MNERIESLVDRMAQLENELHSELKDCEIRYKKSFVQQVSDLKSSVVSASEELKENVRDVERSSTLRHLASAPFIYLMIIPLAFLDLTLSAYQAICFRLYGVARVKRSEHFIIDRLYLDNLTGIDKLNCTYCGYGNGVITYAREIISRTEQYWCPIKHAQKTHSTSERYREFLEYGDTEDYKEKITRYRDELRRDDKE